MKKSFLALALVSSVLFAEDATVNATMNLMKQGMDQIQNGFLYNNKDDILKGVSIIENANSIFSKVDVKTFIPNNNKVQVTKNVHQNLSKSLQELKEDIEARKYAQATEAYGKVLNNCMACHTVIRGW